MSEQPGSFFRRGQTSGRAQAVAAKPRSRAIVWLILGALTACGRSGGECPRCDTLVIAAAGKPDALLPPLVGTAIGRDVSDLVYERLANLEAGGSPIDSSDYGPGLATRWERVDSLTLRFHLRPGAKWHDGVAVTGGDVVFSFEAYADSSLDASARDLLAGRVVATAPDDSTVVIRFREPDPEQWYDATWHVRVLPRHIWREILASAWASDTASSHLIGSGPFRLGARTPAQSLTLDRVDPSARDGEIRRIVWRFTEDQDAALNLLLSHEADLLESVGDSTRAARVSADSALRVVTYPSAIYGFLGFNLDRAAAAKTRDVRRALAQSIDRATAARAVLGPGAIAPPGPMSRLLWIYEDSIGVLRFDSAAAATAFDGAGWVLGKDGIRRRSGRVLSVDILVPATSNARRNLAQVLQEMWRKAGVRVEITSVDMPVFQQRLRTGMFDSYIGAWLDEPSPRGLAEQWTAAGIGILNYGKYRSARFDSLFRRAATVRSSVAEAGRAWREAMDTLNADAPGIWLYTPMNAAGVARRIEGVTINPYSWLSTLPAWRLSPP